MDFFFVLTGYVVLLAVVGSLISYLYYNDTFHPLILILPAATFVYAYMPFDLYQSGELMQYFSISDLEYVQVLNAAGLTALFVGCIIGSNGLRRDPERRDTHFLHLTPAWQDRLYKLGLVLGGIGFLLYAYQLSNAGGFVSAYSRAKGGGTAASGYLRDFTILTLPAIILLYMSRYRRPWRHVHSILLFLFASPHLVHGLLSARRGPTFLGIAILAAGWYLTRYKRPALWRLLTAGAAVGTLLLVLVTFRGEIYLGSDFLSGPPDLDTVVGQSFTKSTEASYGNEFVYGTKAVLIARDADDFYWGTRYLTHVFIRPIPGFLWPTKYTDVGMGDMLFNAGVVPEEIPVSVAAEIPPGAAPGFIADFYVEFSWLALLAIFGLGWIFGALWRNNLLYGGVWTVIYGGIIGLSLYFVSQTFGAFLFRFLEIVIVSYLSWHYIRNRYVRDTSASASLAQHPTTAA